MTLDVTSQQGCRPQIRTHVERHLGPVTQVFEEGGIDILCVAAAIDRPVHALVTAGMSDLRMNTGGRKDAPSYIELMMTLPERWRLEGIAPADISYWPIRLLAQLAVVPQQGRSSLAWGDTVPNGNPPVPYAPDTAQCGVILAPSLLVAKEFYSLEAGARHVEFYAAIPLYREELQLQQQKGMAFLLSTLIDHQINDLVDTRRRNVAKKRFGIF